MVCDKSHLNNEEIYVKLKEMKEKLRCAEHVADTSKVLLYIGRGEGIGS